MLFGYFMRLQQTAILQNGGQAWLVKESYSILQNILLCALICREVVMGVSDH